MSIRKGDNVIAGASVGFIGKPAWSKVVAITTLPFTAPKDGVLLLYVGASDGHGARTFYINGVEVGRYASTVLAVQTLVTIPINQGDVFTSDAGVWGIYRFVPFEYSGVSDINVITPEYIKNLHDPDWTQAVQITAAQLNTGWTAAKRGIVTGTGYGPTLNSCIAIKLNNSIVVGVFGGTDFAYGALHTPVNSGDVIKSESSISAASVQFIPYKAQ